MSAIESPKVAADQTRPIVPRRFWIWAVGSCLILGAAAGARAWQHTRFEGEEGEGLKPLPFPLGSLPINVGHYHAQEGVDMKLDPAVMRYAGGKDDLVRTYVDEDTGISLMVMVLYGRADRVVEHIPDLCYSGAGYVPSQVGPGRRDRAIEFEGIDGRPESASFRIGVYEKGLAQGSVQREEAYHAFRFRDRWSPENPMTGRNRRPFGIFKIQVQRRLGPYEYQNANRRNAIANPCEAFLQDFLATFEQRLAEAQRQEQASAAPSGNGPV
ncbi:MAG: hypothetical protein U0800_17005 [Isosphaeraceae bacterium]